MTFSEKSALSSRNYRIYLYGSIFSLLGIWIQRLAIGWHAWLLSESAVVVGLVSAVQFLPVVFLTPFFGVLVDRMRVQTGTFVMNVMMGAIAGTLGAVTLSGTMSTEVLISLALIHGLIVSFYTPARMALVPDLVPARLVPSAVAISAIVFNLSRFIGPGIAGYVIAAWGIGWAYLVNATTYLPVLLSIALLNIDHRAKPSITKGPYLDQLREGLTYTHSHPVIRRAILLALAGAFCGRGVLELMPAFAGLVFEGGSSALAVLMSSAGVGALAASFAMSWRSLQVRLQTMTTVGCVGVTLSLGLFSFTTGLAAGAFAVGTLALATTFTSVGSQSLVQGRVENHLRGRVMSIWTLVGMGSPAISSILGGIMIREFGAFAAILFYALLCLSLLALFGRGQSMRTIVSSS